MTSLLNLQRAITYAFQPNTQVSLGKVVNKSLMHVVKGSHVKFSSEVVQG